MPKHHKPDAPPRARDARTPEGAARDAGRKLLALAGGAILVVLLGAYLLMRR